MDFTMTTRKLEARRVQMLDFDWFKTDHRAVLSVLSLKAMMGYSDDSWQLAATETLPLLVETAKAHKLIETKERRVQRRRKPPRKHKANISTGVRLRNKRSPTQFSQASPKTSIQSLRTKETLPNPRELTGLSLWNAVLDDETGECTEQTEKLGRVHRIRSQRLF